MAVRVLLVDDNPDQAVLTKRVLKGFPEYVLDAAGDAAGGLEKLLAGGYDLILCDYRLPGTSGIEFLKQLKAHGQDVPVVIITAAGSERVAVEAIQQGAYDYVVKDVGYESLLPGILQRVIERHREKKQLECLQADRDRALEALKKEKESLQALNQTMFNREERVLELKDEVNALLKELGREPKYGV